MLHESIVASFVVATIINIALLVYGRRGRVRAKDLTARAEAVRGAPKTLPMGHDEVTRWDVAQTQCKFEAEFASFVLLLTNHLPPVRDKAEAYRRALQVTLVWHGQNPQEPPTAQLFDVLHKEDAAAP